MTNVPTPLRLARLVSVGRAMGDRRAIGRTLTLASSLAVSVGIVIAGLFYKHSAGLLSLMGAPPEVMSLAVPYLRWRASAFPANLFLLVACGAFRCALHFYPCCTSLDVPLHVRDHNHGEATRSERLFSRVCDYEAPFYFVIGLADQVKRYKLH